MFELKGKTAVITGASSGIGMAAAELFAKRGASVVLVARREDELKKLSDKIAAAGGCALPVPGDVTEEGIPEAVCEKAAAAFGSVDILVNSAGITDKVHPAIQTSDELWDKVYTLDVDALFRFCRAALRCMTRQDSGAIVNVASVGGIRPVAGAAYSSAKAAVIGLTKNIGLQYAGSAIRCNAVCPGFTETPMVAPDPEMDEEMFERVMRHGDTSVGMCTTEDIANTILFLASDEARSITGQYLVVDRGCFI